MKISYLSASIIPSREANSLQIMRMCAAFVRGGHEVTLFFKPSSAPESGQEPFSFYGLNERFKLRERPKRGNSKIEKWWFVRSLRRAVRKLSPDLIYARDLRAAEAVSDLNVPLILETHMMPQPGNQARRQEKLLQTQSHCHLVVISQALRDDYCGALPWLDPKTVRVAPDGADRVATGLAPKPLAAGFNVGYVGNLYPGHGLEMISQLCRACRWATFHVVGGKEEDLKFWREKTGDINNLVWHGFVAPSESGAYLAAFDVVLAPYQPDAQSSGGPPKARWMSPLKLFEYMAHGKPMIVSDLPVIREVIKHEVNGLLCPFSDVDAWCQALVKLRDDPTLGHRLGTNAHSEFETRYTWDARATKVLAGVPLAN